MASCNDFRFIPGRASIYAYVLLLFISCTKSDKELPASLQDIFANDTSCICQPTLEQFKWKNQTVYVLSVNSPTCDTQIKYYNDLGKEIMMPQGYTHSDFIRESQFLKRALTCNK